MSVSSWAHPNGLKHALNSTKQCFNYLSMSMTYVRVFVCLLIIVVYRPDNICRLECVWFVCFPLWRPSNTPRGNEWLVQKYVVCAQTSCRWLRTVISNGVGNPVLCILLNSSWAHNTKRQNNSDSLTPSIEHRRVYLQTHASVFAIGRSVVLCFSCSTIHYHLPYRRWKWFTIQNVFYILHEHSAKQQNTQIHRRTHIKNTEPKYEQN